MDEHDKITVFAKTNFRNNEVPFGIKTDDRRRHMYVIGKTGMGKTTLMENMVIQDIRNGHGVAFLDPHGDSVQRILDCVPASRVNDVIYFNPADLDHPLAFNILESVDSRYKHLVASGLMGVFTKIWANLWSARMEYILNNTILALLDSPGNTLLGITRMYVDKKYRKKIVDNVKDPMVRTFWTDEFANYNEKYRTEAIAPIQNKVGQFLSSGIIRNIVGQPRSTIDLREVMDQQKILIMDLSKGKVGEDNSALLGAMLVTKLQLAAMSRTDIPENQRKDFYLYVDEFQNFATDSFATILSEARKYRLNLVVGHQYIGQLVQEKNTKVRDAIFGNVGTLVVFRIGAEDAEFLVKEFEPVFTEIDIVNLPKYHILLKLMINGVASEPFSAITMSPNPNFVTGNADKVIKVSRERYANSVAEVEEKISRWMGAEYHQETAILIGEESRELEKPEKENLTQPIIQKELSSPKQLTPNFTESAPADSDPVFVEEKKPVSPKESHSSPQPFKEPPRPQPAAHQPTHKTHEPRHSPRQQQGGPSFRQRDQSHRGDHSHYSKLERDKHFSHSKSVSHHKKENPIWEKVMGIHSEKKQEQKQKSEAMVHSLESLEVAPPPVVPSPKPQPVHQPHHQPQPQPHHPHQSGQHQSRTILKPGESSKI